MSQKTHKPDPRPETTSPPVRRAARVTVNLNSKSTRALDEIVANSDDSQTDVINRAIQVYAYLEAAMAEGSRIYLEDPGSQTRERLRFF